MIRAIRDNAVPTQEQDLAAPASIRLRYCRHELALYLETTMATVLLSENSTNKLLAKNPADRRSCLHEGHDMRVEL